MTTQDILPRLAQVKYPTQGEEIKVSYECMCANHQTPGHIGVGMPVSVNKFYEGDLAQDWLNRYSTYPYIEVTAHVSWWLHEKEYSTSRGEYQTLFLRDIPLQTFC